MTWPEAFAIVGVAWAAVLGLWALAILAVLADEKRKR